MRDTTLFKLDKELISELIELRHDLHRHPELSGQEYETQKRIATFLERHGIHSTPALHTGLIVNLQGTGPSTQQSDEDAGVVLLRADIDALPITEQTDLPQASQNPAIMHACGHDTHASMLAVALVVLHRYRTEWNGRVRGIFQPAEEVGTHTMTLVEDGIMDDVSNVFALHVMPELPFGTVGCNPDAVMAGSEDFVMKLTGPGGHGGRPHLGIDGVLAGTAMVQALQAVVSREINPLDPAVLTIGAFNAGSRSNILAPEAELQGNMRFFTNEVGDQMKEKINRIAENIADAYRMELNLHYSPRLEPVTNSAGLTADLWHYLEDVAASQHASETNIPSPVHIEPLTVSEDFSRYQAHAPGVMAFLGTAIDGDPMSAMPLHDASFYPPDKVLAYGSALHIAAVMCF